MVGEWLFRGVQRIPNHGLQGVDYQSESDLDAPPRDALASSPQTGVDSGEMGDKWVPEVGCVRAEIIPIGTRIRRGGWQLLPPHRGQRAGRGGREICHRGR